MAKIEELKNKMNILMERRATIQMIRNEKELTRVFTRAQINTIQDIADELCPVNMKVNARNVEISLSQQIREILNQIIEEERYLYDKRGESINQDTDSPYEYTGVRR